MHQNIDIELMQQISSLLKPFKDVTKIMSSEHSASISLIRPLLSQLVEITKPVTDIDATVIHEAKAAMHHDLEQRYI